MPPKKQSDLCGNCGKVVSDLGISCDDCNKWFHPICQGLEIEVFKYLTSSEMPWFCGLCKKLIVNKIDLSKRIDDISKKVDVCMSSIDVKVDKLSSFIKAQIEEVVQNSNQKFEVINNKLNDVQKRISERIDMVENKMMDFDEGTRAIKEKIDVIEREINDIKFVQDKSADGQGIAVQDYINKNIVEIMENYNKQMIRDKNIIIFNIKEDWADSESVTKEKDKMLIESMLSMIEMSESLGKIQWNRVSKKVEGKCRPLLISFASVKEKWKFYSGHKTFKKSNDGTFKNISIVPDRTLEQRSEAKRLRTELLQRRNEGLDVVIFRNKITERNKLPRRDLSTEGGVSRI